MKWKGEVDEIYTFMTSQKANAVADREMSP